MAFLFVVGRVLSMSGLHLTPVLLKPFEHEILQRVVAEHGREGHVGAGGAQMLGDDAGAADVIDLLVEQDADRRRLGLAADHGACR